LPKYRLFRAILFPFYTGSANCLVWLALLGLGIFVVFVVVTQTGEVFDAHSFYWFLFSFDYCVTAMFIRLCFFPKKTTPELTLKIVISLFLLFVPGGILACYLFQNSASIDFDLWDSYSQSIFSALNPFMLQESLWDSNLQTFAASLWGLGLIVPLSIWFLLRVRHFSPNDVDETMTLEQAIAAIREAEANPLVQSDRERAKKENANTDSAFPVPSPSI
jgi:hypothetical protein